MMFRMTPACPLQASQPGTCLINVSRIEADPESAEITGPATVGVDQTVELDESVADAKI